MKRRTATPPRKKGASSAGSGGVLLVGSFKLLKGLALLCVGLGLHHLLHRDVAQTVNRWVSAIRVDPDNHYVHGLISRAVNVSPKQLGVLSIGTFFYAALTLTEGIGLLRRKRWAEYFTVISTGLLIPIEVYELARQVTPSKVAVFAINLLVLIYLAARLRSTRR